MINNAHLIGFCIAYFNGCFSDFHSKFLQSHKFYFLILPKQTKKALPEYFQRKLFYFFLVVFQFF
ncbi:TPA_asm: hypothetical protein GF783_02085 [Listeria monocytogenes]|nr:hypothetical protein [Listeria monocytogenes]